MGLKFLKSKFVLLYLRNRLILSNRSNIKWFYYIFVFCGEYKETALHILILLIINTNYYDDNKIIQIEILNVFNAKILL